MTSCSTSSIRSGTQRPDTAIFLPCGRGLLLQYNPELYLLADINALLFSDYLIFSPSLALSSSMTLQIYGYLFPSYFIIVASTLQPKMTCHILEVEEYKGITVMVLCSAWPPGRSHIMQICRCFMGVGIRLMRLV